MKWEPAWLVKTRVNFTPAREIIHTNKLNREIARIYLVLAVIRRDESR